MTRNSRSKQNLEKKIVELYIRLKKRKTNKISRKGNLKNRLEFFKKQLQEITDAEATQALAETDQTITSLSTDSSAE
jgi:epoxyqueuosine reductase QueG